MFSNERQKEMYQDGRGNREDLGGVERGEIIIMIHYVGKRVFLIRSKISK